MTLRCQHCTILVGPDFIETHLHSIHEILVCDSCYAYLSTLKGIEVYNWKRKYLKDKKDYARI